MLEGFDGDAIEEEEGLALRLESGERRQLRRPSNYSQWKEVVLLLPSMLL